MLGLNRIGLSNVGLGAVKFVRTYIPAKKGMFCGEF